MNPDWKKAVDDLVAALEASPYDAAPTKLRQGCGTYLHTDGSPLSEAELDAVWPAAVKTADDGEVLTMRCGSALWMSMDEVLERAGDSSPGRFDYHVEFIGDWPLKKVVDLSKYPHTCGCGAPCYDSGFSVKCSSATCKHHEAS